MIVLKKDNKGVNEHFYDFDSSKVLSRAEFIAEIQADHYPGYGIRGIRGVDYPFSKRDGDPLNNLG
ncbi:MAG: hypothetical protein FJ146_12510 [Deltaproteobacteria bacterium]|nr:hypothetical protein [Deltaproteobacteria bacterium]